MNTIFIVCNDCGHTTETADREMIGQECAFFGPGTGEGDEGCAGTYRRKWTAVGVPLRATGFYNQNYK